MPSLRTVTPVTPTVIPFGKTDSDSIYFNGSEVGYWVDFEAKKELNRSSSFNATFLGLGSDERDLISTNNEFMLFQDNDLFLKGTVLDVEYGGDKRAFVKGVGQEVGLARRDVEREEFSSTSVSGILTKLCSDDLSGSSFILNIGSNPDYGVVSVKGEHVSRLDYVGRVLDKIGWDWRVDASGNDFGQDYVVFGSYVGDPISQFTFTTSGANRNCSAVKKFVDEDKVANIVKVLGYGQGVNQVIGSYSDSASVTGYGSRYATFTDRSLISSVVAGSMASGLVNQLKIPPTTLGLEVRGFYNTGSSFNVGDKVTVNDVSLGLNSDFRVQSITRKNGPRTGPVMFVEVGNKRRGFKNELARINYSSKTQEMFAMGDTVCYMTGETDNCDGSNGLLIDFYIPDEMVSLNTLKLNYKISAYRVWSQGGADGGGTTKSSDDGGADTVTSNDNSSSFTSNETDTPADWYVGTAGAWETGAATTFTVPNPLNPSSVGHFVQTIITKFDETGGLSVRFLIDSDGNGSYESHLVEFSEYIFDITGDEQALNITLPTAALESYVNDNIRAEILSDNANQVLHDLAFQIGILKKHTHNVTLDDHTHNVTLSNHTHSLNYGISTDGGYSVNDMTIEIDGVDKTSDFESENGTLNVTGGTTSGNLKIKNSWLSSPIEGEWHTIELKPNDECRLKADLFIQGFIEDKIV